VGQGLCEYYDHHHVHPLPQQMQKKKMTMKPNEKPGIKVSYIWNITMAGGASVTAFVARLCANECKKRK
jgi:hypothetical protein